jgi:hypothetical protein
MGDVTLWGEERGRGVNSTPTLAFGLWRNEDSILEITVVVLDEEPMM